MENNSSSMGCVASVSWFPTCQSPIGFRLLGREIHSHEVSSQSYNNTWRHFIRRLIREGRKIYIRPKPLDFRYDEASYAKNFDEGFLED